LERREAVTEHHWLHRPRRTGSRCSSRQHECVSQVTPRTFALLTPLTEEFTVTGYESDRVSLTVIVVQTAKQAKEQRTNAAHHAVRRSHAHTPTPTYLHTPTHTYTYTPPHTHTPTPTWKTANKPKVASWVHHALPAEESAVILLSCSGGGTVLYSTLHRH
jgi:hypothetical protein